MTFMIGRHPDIRCYCNLVEQLSINFGYVRSKVYRIQVRNGKLKCSPSILKCDDKTLAINWKRSSIRISVAKWFVHTCLISIN